MSGPFCVFVGFSAEDRYTIAEPIVYHLKNYGISTWYDRQKLLLGDNRTEKNLIDGAGRSTYACNGVQREHNKKLNNGLPILHKVPPKRDYGRYFCIMAEKGGTSHGGLTEKLSPFFHAKKQEVNAYGR